MTYTPAIQHAHFGHLLVGIKDSQDGGSVGGLVGTFANAEYEQGLGTFNNRVDQAMARLA